MADSNGQTAFKSAKLALVTVLLCGVQSGFAATTWSLNSSCTNSGGDANGYGNTRTCAASPSGGNVAVTAWSTTGTNSTYQDAKLTTWSGGMGVENRQGSAVDGGSPQHSIDNSGATDLVRLSFASSTVLTQVNMGWINTDADFSLLRWGGNGNATSVAGRSIAQILSDGWQLVGNYAGYGTTSASYSFQVNSTGLSSSWWLISAFNSGFGAGCISQPGTSGTGCGSSTADYFKVASVIGSAPPPPHQTPEPSSLALMGLAALGLLASRRKSLATA